MKPTTRAALVCALGFLWLTLFWFEPARTWPLRSAIDRAAYRLLEQRLGLDAAFAWTIRSWFFVLVPVAVLRLTGRTLAPLGLGRMATTGWRIVSAGFVAALPALVWLGLRPGIQLYYRALFEPGGWKLFVAYLLVIVVEHVWVAGVVLALALPDGRLPEHLIDPPRRGMLQAFGFGTPVGGPKGVSAWLGISPDAWPAIVGQALVFGAIHMGKDPGELATSFPGGLAIGIITYRVGSIWPTVALHAGTSAVVVLTAYLAL